MPRLRTVEPRLHVEDLSRAIDFYTRVLGFRVDTVFPDETPVFAMLSRDGVCIQLGGLAGTRVAADRSTCTLWIDVADILEMHRAIASQVAIEWGPEVYFYHRREFGFRDPDGNLLVMSEETDDPVTCREE